MANLTKAEVADRAMQALGFLGAGQEASAEDSNRAQESVQTVYEMLRKEGVMPFSVEAVEEWAQSALIHIVAFDLAATFGVTGARLESVAMLAQKGRADLSRQMTAKIHPLATRPDYF